MKIVSRLIALFVVLLRGGAQAEQMTVAWTNNMLSISSPHMPGGTVDVWYLEAFCKSGSTGRKWQETTIPHTTKLVRRDGDGRRLRLQTLVEPSVEVRHDIRAGDDEVEFRLELRNKGTEFVEARWFQPCMRVDRFCGGTQSNYIAKSFIFTANGLTTLDHTRRTEEALYRGGQVYVPAGINLDDVNPRPISPDKPVNGLIGCFSADSQYLLATAWDETQELFQGVIVCLHNDPRVGGLKPGEAKKLRGKIYFMKNDAQALLRRYRRDFNR